MSQLHISISAEPVMHLGSIPVTNSMLTSWIVSFLIIAVAVWAKNNVKMTKRPKGLQNVLEMFIEGLYGLTNNITESAAKTKYIFPFVLSFFTFILLNNWFGLLPGVGTILIQEPEEATAVISQAYASEPTEEVTEAAHEEKKFVPLFRAATADLNTTIALALVSVIGTQFIGVKFLGLSYFKKFFNFKGPIDGFVGFLELVSEVSKILSFSFRLFGNIFAGEVLLAVMAFLLPLVAPIPFLGLEIFVGVIQAFVFAMLTLVFMNMASTSHQHEEHA